MLTTITRSPNMASCCRRTRNIYGQFTDQRLTAISKRKYLWIYNILDEHFRASNGQYIEIITGGRKQSNINYPPTAIVMVAAVEIARYRIR